mmetsp:Transcript_4501/g.9678  ORF Transcript_4501/g.9678 Transcript_4501/m.9678 type:complete len:465 (-) Transcript_4501:162-1556(-)
MGKGGLSASRRRVLDVVAEGDRLEYATRNRVNTTPQPQNPSQMPTQSTATPAQTQTTSNTPAPLPTPSAHGAAARVANAAAPAESEERFPGEIRAEADETGERSHDNDGHDAGYSSSSSSSSSSSLSNDSEDEARTGGGGGRKPTRNGTAGFSSVALLLSGRSGKRTAECAEDSAAKQEVRNQKSTHDSGNDAEDDTPGAKDDAGFMTRVRTLGGHGQQRNQGSEGNLSRERSASITLARPSMFSGEYWRLVAKGFGTLNDSTLFSVSSNRELHASLLAIQEIYVLSGALASGFALILMDATDLSNAKLSTFLGFAIMVTLAFLFGICSVIISTIIFMGIGTIPVSHIRIFAQHLAQWLVLPGSLLFLSLACLGGSLAVSAWLAPFVSVRVTIVCIVSISFTGLFIMSLHLTSLLVSVRDFVQEDAKTKHKKSVRERVFGKYRTSSSKSSFSSSSLGPSLTSRS